ncbi:flagellar basal body rod protein FlgB [Polynucleobacter sp. MWH-Mekk-B1]|uniref:flagellar basal body rod protein FlgB n=1 Tax=Polynucleobacter finlandensis TaxID=1855894 RepID=UPI001C0AD9B5|nr:flagellar basal body rod protein FlgB [Polynucleobacter finlandensis]MBU3545104.1 flagellar basal body rod protein FlgB [Polynucleobacter finlandensis]
MTGLDSIFGFHEAALKVREQRQELLAANIANSDTPNYKARDIDFSSAMKNALAVKERSVGGAGATTGMATTSALHLSNGATPSAGNGNFGDVLFRSSVQDSVDGNTVDGDVERNAFTDNAIRYEASLTMLKSDIKDMMSAIQG